MSILLNNLEGYTIQAVDGNIGHAGEFYFDDSTWAVRYLVVDMHWWFVHKKVLLTAGSLLRPDGNEKIIRTLVSMEQVENSPKIDTDQPIILQHQAKLHKHYGWEFYWGAEALASLPDLGAYSEMETLNTGGKPFDPHLRTTRVVTGYQVEALSGIVGTVDDFLLDSETWTIRYLVVETEKGKTLLLPTQTVERISFEESKIYVSISDEKIEDYLDYNYSRPAGSNYRKAAESKYRFDISTLI